MGAVIVLPGEALRQRRIGLRTIRAAMQYLDDPTTPPEKLRVADEAWNRGTDCMELGHAIFLRANGLNEPRPYWFKLPAGPSR